MGQVKCRVKRWNVRVYWQDGDDDGLNMASSAVFAILLLDFFSVCLFQAFSV